MFFLIWYQYTRVHAEEQAEKGPRDGWVTRQQPVGRMDRTGGGIAGFRGTEDNIGAAIALAQDGGLLDLKFCGDAAET